MKKRVPYRINNNCRNGIVAILLCFTLVPASFAQTTLKNWNTAQANLSVTRKLDFKIGYLKAFNLNNGFTSDFSQASISADYDITKHFTVSSGVVLGTYSKTNDANRVLLRVAYKTRVADILTWTNSLQAEVHSNTQTHYKERIIYSTRIGTRKRLTALKLAPSVAYALYYNIGGKPIQYYDKNNQPAVQSSPDGFHRGRLYFNLNSRLSRYFSLTLYYMMQREFNLFTNQYHAMNVTNPANGKIVRPFNDYNVIGTTLTVNINIYKKKDHNTEN